MEQLSLKKQVDNSAAIAEITLKKMGLSDTKANVVLALDVSGSMTSMYNNGMVQDFVIRILGLAKQFHISEKIDVYAFGTKAGYIGTFDINTITAKQIKDVYDKNLLGGSTNFAELFTLIGNNKQVKTNVTVSNPKLGWFKKLICKLFNIRPEVQKAEYIEKQTVPTYAVVMTDGEPSDASDAVKAITKVSKNPVFFQFVAISRRPIDFLDELDTLEGRVVDNANVFYSDTPNSLKDNVLYDRLLGEYPYYLQAIKKLKML